MCIHSLILTTGLSWSCDYPHFVDEETEVDATFFFLQDPTYFLSHTLSLLRLLLVNKSEALEHTVWSGIRRELHKQQIVSVS